MDLKPNMTYWEEWKIPPTAEYQDLPEWIQYDLTTYLAEGRYGGSDFLRAVLENNLSSAIGYMDDSSLKYLRSLVMVIYNRMPGVCFGSREKVKAWQELGGWKGFRVMEPLEP